LAAVSLIAICNLLPKAVSAAAKFVADRLVAAAAALTLTAVISLPRALIAVLLLTRLASVSLT